MLLQITEDLLINEDMIASVERMGTAVYVHYIDYSGQTQSHMVNNFEAVELWQMLCKVANQNADGGIDFDLE